MTKWEFLFKLIKERILKLKTIIILFLLALAAVHFFPLCYHTFIKLLNPDLKESKINTPFGESSNKYRFESYAAIDRENPESLVPENKDNEILRLKKQHIVDLATITVATPTHQIEYSPIIIDLAESLKDLRISDPDSEIIPLTEGFLLKSYTAEDFEKVKAINGVWGN